MYVILSRNNYLRYFIGKDKCHNVEFRKINQITFPMLVHWENTLPETTSDFNVLREISGREVIYKQ